LVRGSAIAGICLIRLEEIRPKGMPSFVGVSSENEIRGRFDGYSHLPIDMDGDGDEDFINVN